ncbi:MAG: GatB/YqeY domain-containing protein [Anaerolineaceae bacterium]
MNIKEQLENELKEALRSNDEFKKGIIRMALSSIKFMEKENRKELTDIELVAIIQKEIKSRKESIADAEKANRTETIVILKSEITVLEKYLPEQMSEAELEQIITSAINEANASSPTDIGKVMKIVMPKVQGKAPADQVSLNVRQQLQKLG